MTNLITVFAAAGRQGVAAVNALLAAGNQVRSVSRNPNRPELRRQAAAGAEIVAGSFDDLAAVTAALQGAAGLFFYHPIFISPQATPGVGPEDELRRGRMIFDAALRAGVKHTVYSSALSADRPNASSSLRPKGQLEEYLRASGLASTVLRPVGFMENYLGPARGLRRDGTLASTTPPKITEQLIAVRDIGSFAALAFNAPQAWFGRAINIAGDELTTPQIAAAIERATRRAVHYNQILLDEIHEKDPQRARTVVQMQQVDRPAADLKLCHAANPNLVTFEAWLGDPHVTETLTAYLTDASSLE